MTEKEISEIRRRFKSEKCSAAKIRGCLVNEKGEIVTEFSQPIGTLLQDEADEVLTVMKKTLSGGIGKNLIDIEFANQQVLEGEEHKLLMSLKGSSLNDDAAVAELFGKVINTTRLDGNYLIMLINDKYDVFSYTEDGKKSEDSSTVFSYIICCVCPIKITKPALTFYATENTFKNIAAGSVVGAPELGFMFPTFDDRAANIYNALFYTKNTSDSHSDFIDSIFKCQIPMPATEQKENFSTIIENTIPDEKKFDVIEAIHDEICNMVEEHKANKENEPLKISKDRLKTVLEDCEIDTDNIAKFEEQFNESFGEKTKLCPQNIIDTKQFTLQTPDVSIKVNPERSDLVKTQIIDGAKYILIRADENVEVNGISVNIY